MQTPAKIVFRGLAQSTALDAEVRRRIESLARCYRPIVACRVLVEIPHRHRHNGRHCHVRIDVTMPGGAPVVVSHSPSWQATLKGIRHHEYDLNGENDHLHGYAVVAVGEAFEIARRLLQAVAGDRGGTAAAGQAMPYGEVSKLWPREGFGFIEADHRQLYFSRANVLDNGFDDIEVGTPVAFVEERGDLGLQARTVRVLAKPSGVMHRGHRS